jgi:clan AA aspartic protease
MASTRAGSSRMSIELFLLIRFRTRIATSKLGKTSAKWCWFREVAANDACVYRTSLLSSFEMGLTHVTVKLRTLGNANGDYEAEFLVDTGATDSLAPASELRKVGIGSVGKTVYELADGSVQEYEFGLAEISFMGEVTAGRIIFGPDNAEPLLGVTALESVGITIDPANRTLKRLPAIPLK